MAKELENILKSVDELATRGKITRNRAFAAWFAINFFDLDEDDALESAAADGGNDQGIDIVFVDSSSEEIVVLQAHCPENFEKKTPKNKWDAVVTALPFIKSPKNLSKAGRPDLAETLETLKTTHPDYTYAVGLITLGLKSDAIERSLVAHQNDDTHKNVTFFHYAQEDITTKYQALVDAETGIPEDELHFAGSHFEDNGDYGRAWIGSVTAAELKRLHKLHQDKLFAGNIRLFLGSRKGGINEQIIKTAQSSPGNFWALNNGITIVADSASISEDKKGSVLKLKRFSIVNGCQTTSSLVRADAKPAAKVLARVIAAKVGLKNEIVRYNNSQNAVRIWTVRAADDIQEQLRKDFNSVGITYAPKQSGSRRKRDSLTIELDKVTQYLASAEQQYLIQAIDNKSELFDEPYQKLFKKGIKAPAVYLAWLVGSISDQERQKLADGLGDDPNASLLGVTSGYWIIYCSYKMLGKFSDLESIAITLEKMKRPEFQSALLKYVKQAVSMFYDAAVDTYDRDQFGSFKSTLRSSKFLQKIDSKMNSRIVKLAAKSLPDLAAVCKSIRLP
ncbi:MAG: AIPR family protein [Pseudomonadota bacterium]